MILPDSRERDRQAGFTLIEVLVVLAILGFAVAIIAARGPATSLGFEARDAAGRLARGLRLARSEAIRRNVDVAFSLDAARHGYRIGDGAWQALPPGLGVDLRIGGKASGQGRIVFSPDGGATGGKVRVSTGETLIGVDVDWLSGRVVLFSAGADAAR